ncbi:MAG TPA: hypothetical protein VGX76_23380, partial [Pirellulales bacterium]|nr:hypothetical protein [Pirellulales bacterium]
AGGSGTVTIWDPATGQLVKTLRPGAGSQELFQVAWSPDGRRLAWSGTASLVRIWDYSTGHETESLGSQSQGAMSLAWAPDGGRLAVANGDRVGVWHTPYGGTARLEEINRRHADRVFSVAWSPDGERLASVGADRTLRIWDAQRSTPGGLVEVTGAPVRALAWDRSAAVWRGLRG